MAVIYTTLLTLSRSSGVYRCLHEQLMIPYLSHYWPSLTLAHQEGSLGTGRNKERQMTGKRAFDCMYMS